METLAMATNGNAKHKLKETVHATNATGEHTLIQQKIIHPNGHIMQPQILFLFSSIGEVYAVRTKKYVDLKDIKNK